MIIDRGVMQATRGAIFVADAETQLPTAGVKAFTLDADNIPAPNGKTWVNIGHTSNDTLPEFATDGGDPTTQDTWLRQALRTTYDAVTGSCTFNSVQCDAETLKMVFNAVDMEEGGVAFGLTKTEQKKAVFVLWQDTNTNERGGIWLPNTSTTYSSLPTLNNEGFNEFSIQANILTSNLLPRDKSGNYTCIAMFDPDDFNPRTVTKVELMNSEGTSTAPNTVKVDESVEYGVRITYSDGSTEFQTTVNVTYVSSQTNYATFEGNRLTGVAEGTTEVTAEVGETTSEPVSVTVSAA